MTPAVPMEPVMPANASSADALGHVRAAADGGNVDALMHLAVAYLAGQAVPRDVAAARSFIRRAVAIGHVDGALMEVALTANGSGGPRDWTGALTLLRSAASTDPVALAQLALVERMNLRSDGTPSVRPQGDTISSSPNVVHFKQLLTVEECSHVARATADLLEPASVLDPQTGQRIRHPVRTSHDGTIGPAREDLVVRAINLRIAAATGTSVDQGEALTILRYAPGQEYRPHVDAIAGSSNQRIKTILVYLNEGYGGGETAFLANGLTVKGGTGDAILFDNVLSDGSPDPSSRHAGLPVRSGVKWLATRWIRAKPLDPWDPATAS
ncbi:MAG: 2OG-Fe(II) oxygenase [Sphingomonadaceae bacterium]